MIRLPSPLLDGDVSVERTMQERRSVRDFQSDGSLDMDELGQLLWAAQGVTLPQETSPEGFGWTWMGGRRTAPSAGALYPLELYVVVGSVEGVEPGFYRYLPTAHALETIRLGDLRETLWNVSLRQTAIQVAPVTLVFGAVVARAAVKYGERAEQYTHIEVGAAGENVYLQCESLGLGTVFMGAFSDDGVKEALALPEDQRVFGLMPVGKPAEG
jgi:SagB-type dehydrogenase family enzyme